MRRLLTVMMAATLATPALAARPGPIGVWRNAANSVHIRTARCGGGLCGTVIWANEKAKADVAAQGGTLVGAELFHDMAADGDSSWSGEVFVPDLGRSFAGSLQQTGPDTLVAEGCLFAGIGCRTQTWTRLPR